MSANTYTQADISESVKEQKEEASEECEFTDDVVTDFEVFDSSTNLNDLASEHRARSDGVLEVRK